MNQPAISKPRSIALDFPQTTQNNAQNAEKKTICLKIALLPTDQQNLNVEKIAKKQF